MSHFTARHAAFSLLGDNIRVGDTINFKTDQLYTVTGFELTENGKTFMRLKSHCKACGAPFTCASSVVSNGITRHCEQHKEVRRKKGKTENNSKRKKWLLSIEEKYTINGEVDRKAYLDEVKQYSADYCGETIIPDII